MQRGLKIFFNNIENADVFWLWTLPTKLVSSIEPFTDCMTRIAYGFLAGRAIADAAR